MNGVDDGTVHINLGHTFPYYGGVFTDAWMSSNGFIMLYDPTTGFGNSSTWNNGCCNGFNPAEYNYAGNSFSYMLAPLWTDLIHITSVPDSGYFYETGEGGTSFLWKNIAEFYDPNNLNTFGVQLWPDGSFDFHYDEVNITNHTTWIGFTGDTTSQSGNVYDEVNELFYKTAQEGGMTTEHIANFASEQTEYGYAWYGQDGGYQPVGPDCSNPLNDPSCPGYDDAYFEQQCEQNQLYDTQCPGYAQAYYDQQCSSDPLYDSGCPGYADAYYDQQCSTDPLYDSGCSGYAEALFDYNCTLDSQYDMMCPGYIDEEMFAVDDTTDDFSGADDGSDDGTGFDMYGVEETFYEEPMETYFEEQYVDEPEEFVQEEVVMFTEPEELDTGPEELVANDGSVNEEQVLQESIAAEEEIIEEELVILEEMEVVEVLEERVLEEEVELDEVELVPVTEKVVATTKVDVTSLVLAQTAELVSNLREESESSSQNSSSLGANGSIMESNSQEFTDDSADNGSNSQEFAQQTENLVNETENSGEYVSPEQILFGSDSTSFAMMTGNATDNTENATENEQNVTDTENVEQNLALGDSAPIGFAIIPVQQSGGVVEVVIPVEDQSLAERLAEQVRQRNLENSNDAAVGQTAVLQQIASGTDMSSYYNQTVKYTQDVYTQKQVYGNIVLTDNAKSRYKMFSENHGTMQELIRSQY